MVFLEWNPEKLALGVAQMDAEHQELIRLMNDLHAGHEAGEPVAKLQERFAALERCTLRHFADEEAHMERIDFPERGKHARIHQDLLRKLGEHKAAFVASGELTKELFHFLRLWLSAHIMNIDAKYAAHPAPTS